MRALGRAFIQSVPKDRQMHFIKNNYPGIACNKPVDNLD